jgi:DNA primase
MEKRGIPVEVSAQYDLTYWASKQRVIFPIYLDGLVYGYQARTIVNAEPKILGSKGLKRDRLVMFSQRLTGDHAVVCEGPIDALKAHLCGGNVATMGKAVSSKQIELLRSKGVRKLYLALDPDAADETAKLVRDNWQDFEVYQMEVPHPYKDFGEMSFGEVRDCFDAAKRANPAKLFLYLKKPSF